MRLAVLSVIAIGCGGHASQPVQSPAAAIAATRWVPAQPTYLIASPTLGEAHHRLRDAIDLLGAATGHDLRDAGRVASALLGVDALDPARLAEIGIDLAASWALFSEELNPTLVVHLAAPDQMAAFLDGQRKRGLVTRSVVVDNTEVVSATLVNGLTISWAIAGDWMWVHLAPTRPGDAGASWFTSSHAPHPARWIEAWDWAQRAAGAAAGVVGFLDLHGLFADALLRAPDAVACGRRLERVGRIAGSLDGDAHHITARVAVDVGLMESIRAMLLPPPSGWAATATQAALAVQWNLDLAQLRSALAPCLAVAGIEGIDTGGIRAARAVLLAFDPGGMSGAGAVALDVADTALLARTLDRIPLRRTLERPRTFGTHKGYSLAIPFSVTIEYVLEPTFAMFGVGEGVLARLAAPGPTSAPSAPIFALDVAPPAMSREAWGAVLHMIAERELSGSPSATTRRVVEQLLAWRDAHVAVTTEATSLVLTLSGTRR